MHNLTKPSSVWGTRFDLNHVKISYYFPYLAGPYHLEYRDTNEKYEKYIMTSKINYKVRHDIKKYVIKYGKYVMISKSYGMTSKCMS